MEVMGLSPFLGRPPLGFVALGEGFVASLRGFVAGVFVTSITSVLPVGFGEPSAEEEAEGDDEEGEGGEDDEGTGEGAHFGFSMLRFSMKSLTADGLGFGGGGSIGWVVTRGSPCEGSSPEHRWFHSAFPQTRQTGAFMVVPIQVFDDFLLDARRQEVLGYLLEPGWEWGWRSNVYTDVLLFWHKHFAGRRGEECGEELRERAPLIWRLWDDAVRVLLPGHTLVRCYANALQYGSDGTVHSDSEVPTSFTSVYYPHGRWDPNWGGETLFYTSDKSDILAVSYPRPGRLVTFPGTIPHRAAGVSRTCPLLRITLMFKTECVVSGQERGQEDV